MWGFPGGSVVKNLLVNAGDAGEDAGLKLGWEDLRTMWLVQTDKQAKKSLP